MIYQTKICEHCGKKYIPNNSIQKYCKECKNEVKKIQKRIRYKNNKELREKSKQRCKIYREQNKDKLKEINKQWREQNKEYLKEYERQRNKTEKRKKYDKERNKKPERIQYKKEYIKEYNKKNRDKINIQRRIKYKTDLNFKLSDWGRKQVKRCLNYIPTNKTKNKHTFDILGYTSEQLKQRLAMNFKSDMNWDNHGTLWHIDHIKALDKFNFILPDGTPDYKQIKLANSLANLKPLYFWENLSKGSK